MSSLSTYVMSTLFNISNKQNIDNFDSVTSTNIITPFDINELISGINGCINYISALSYENDSNFADFWQNPQNYVIKTIDNNFQYVRTFNNITGNVIGVSGITINNITYNSYDNPNPDIGDYLTLYNFPHHIFKAVTTFNNKSGDVSGVSTIKINKKLYSYTDINKGVPNLGYYKIANSYVTSFNDQDGNVYGLYSFSLSSQQQIYPENGKINFYHILTTYLYTDYVSKWAKNTNQYFYKDINNNYPTLEITPDFYTDPNERIIDLEVLNNILSGILLQKDPLQATVSRDKITITYNQNDIIIHIFNVQKKTNHEIIPMEEITITTNSNNEQIINITLPNNSFNNTEVLVYYTSINK